MHLRDEDGVNLPIPNRERNNGGTLEVYHSHHQLNGQHPWRKPAPSDSSDAGDLEKLMQGSPYPPPPSSSRHRLLRNINLPIFILSCALGVVTAALIIVAGLFGSKIANLEDTVVSFPLNLPASSSSSSSSSPADSTTAALSTFTPTLPVPGYTYLGCFYDKASPDRVLRDAFADGPGNMTNTVCADECAERAPGARNFGTQHGTQCFCGTVAKDGNGKGDGEGLGNLRRAPEWSCSYQCSGRGGQTEFCGGNWILSLWEKDGS